MCPVQWRRTSPRPLGPGFLRCPPNRLIVMMNKPGEHAVVTLHWSEADHGSYPCLGPDECKLCPSRKFLHAYTGVYVLNTKSGAWVPAIFDMGDPSHALATSDFTGHVIEVGRTKLAEERSRMILVAQAAHKAIEVPAHATAFDVRPHLLRRWGLFAEADAILTEPYYEQERLKFPDPKAG